MTQALAEPEVTQEELARAAAVMMSFAGLPATDLRLEPIAGGGNNRVFRVQSGGHALLLKQYYHSDDDPRDRLGAEFGFLQYAWSAGVRCVPRPIARQFMLRLGLYEFIEGRPATPADIDAQAAAEAADFVVSLNQRRADSAAAKLPPASDACFCLADHLASVDRRVEALRAIEPAGGIDSDASAFVRQTLVPRWARVREELVSRAAGMGWRLDEPLSPDQRVISPSDFGFHNAILAPKPSHRNGWAFRFIDFEYAGWDDPAKLVADFFNQVAIPVPITFMNGFVDRLSAVLPVGGDLARRAALLMPACRVKWCCMSLGAFLPATRQRRRFARGGDSDTDKAHALRTARLILEHEGPGTDADLPPRH